MNSNQDILKVGLAQMAPIWLDREKTLEKVCTFVENAADQNCELVVFGEALVPGYPFWVERTEEHDLIHNCKKRFMLIISNKECKLKPDI